VTYDLQAGIIRPNNESFRRDMDTINYTGNVSDDCGGVAGASVEFKAYPIEINPSSYCAPGDVTDIGNGNYSCAKVPSESWSFAYHNLTINASKQYYNSSKIILKQDAFVIATNPQLSLITPTSRCTAAECFAGDSNFGWGETWNFSAKVQDLDQGAYSFERMNISLWIDMGAGYQFINSTTCPGPLVTGDCSSQKVITFIQKFGCQNIGTRPYKINVSDHWTYTNESSGSITINPDSVETEYITSPVKVDRDTGSVNGTFVLRIKDLDKNEYLNESKNASMHFTKDGSSFSLMANVTTNAS